jgi:nucleoside-diphosphate-sugar epimerase
MKISILGCGWLGLPLADHLIKKGNSVKGSTTSESKMNNLRQKGITPFLLELEPFIKNPGNVQSFWNSDVLVLNIPPCRRRDNIVDYHKKQITSVAKAVAESTISQVVFVSSTSVYPKLPGLVVEDDAILGNAARDSGNALLEAENLLLNHPKFSTSVLRFGGLYGGERHPVKYLAGRKDVGKAGAAVNLIHRDDCMAIIARIITQNITGEIFNAVGDAHPGRKEYYSRVAQLLELDSPEFKAETKRKNYKIVMNDKLKNQLSYQFIHPDLRWPLN